MKYNRIVLISPYGRTVELTGAGVIKPGHLIRRNANGAALVHGTAGGQAERFLAVEDALQGRTIDAAYAAEEIVTGHLFVPGDVGYAFVKAGSNYAKEAALESAGDGTLRPLNTGVLVAYAEEPTNLTAGGAVDTRIPVRFV